MAHYFPAILYQVAMQIPNSDHGMKRGLALLQPFLVFQLWLPEKDRPFSLELAILDSNKERRRLVLTSGITQSSIQPLHARFPLAVPGDEGRTVCTLFRCVVVGFAAPVAYGRPEY